VSSHRAWCCHRATPLSKDGMWEATGGGVYRVEVRAEGLMMAAHGEQGRRRPWQRVALFEEVEEGRKGRGGREQKSKGACRLK
jgi:hypothetical protein